MTFKTLEGVLNPDGTLTLPKEELPDHAVRVMVTLLEAADDAALAEVGDYNEQLLDYEERLARGEVRWQ
jgi:hypothetical protein